VLRELIEYFTQYSSSVYMASLDARTAFDRIHHIKLFKIMLDRSVPVKIVRIIVSWYSKIVSYVRWNNALSKPVLIKSGIRQGGILSPVLFNMYADVLIESLKTLDEGCHMTYVFIYRRNHLKLI
jgi:hypothetical protein